MGSVSVPVTILMPVYNSQSFLHETIASIINQSLSEFELLIMDDGSTDKSYDLIKSYSDSRIKYHYCNHHFTNTLNSGLSKAQGEYIALMDHDDIMVKDRLKIQYDFMNSNKDIIACGGFMKTFGLYSMDLLAPVEYSNIVLEMIIRSPMCNPTGFLRNSVLKENSIVYNSGYSFAADFKFWSDVVKVGKVVNIPQVLTFYRTSNSQASRVYRKDSQIGAQKIHLEMINYLLSRIKFDSRFYNTLDERLLPALDDLAEASFFSNRTFLNLMYEILSSFHKNQELIL